MNTASSVRMLQAVAVMTGVALLMWNVVLPIITNVAHADALSNASDTISNSAPSAASDHTITFTLPNGMSTNATFEVTFDASFDATSIVLADVDLASNTVDQTLAATNGAGQWGIAGFGTNTWTITSPSDVPFGSSTPLTLYVGESGPNAVGGENQITNPAATSSYPIDIGKGASTIQDSGQVRVAIIDEVTVTASVDASLTFTVQGTSTGITVNGAATTTQAATTNTTLPFGTLDIASSSVIAQDLFVSTNAANGYTVTAEITGPLQSTVGNTIDGFIDGSDTNTPVAWTGPAGTVGSPDTYGHWGITSSDLAVSARASQFTSDTWVAPSTTPIAVMGHGSVVNGTVNGEGYATIGYQIEISALQEAGDDYNTTLRYVATPVF